MGGKADGPDRGWSWVVALVTSINSFIILGTFRSTGVLFVNFVKDFGVTRKEASWPVVLCTAVQCLTGIITGPLAQAFGIRPVVIVGSLVATSGLVACYFTTSLTSITIFYGVVTGVGFGLIVPLMAVAVNEYFVKYRATANGISNSGSCFGSIVLPPLFEFLIEKYDLHGCFLLLGGILLQMTVTGALIRPTTWSNPSAKSCSSNRTDEVERNVQPYSLKVEQKDKSCSSKCYDAVERKGKKPCSHDSTDATEKVKESYNGYLMPVSGLENKGFLKHEEFYERNHKLITKILDDSEAAEMHARITDRKNQLPTNGIQTTKLSLKEEAQKFQESHADCSLNHESIGRPDVQAVKHPCEIEASKKNPDTAGFKITDIYRLDCHANSGISTDEKMNDLKTGNKLDGISLESIDGILMSFRKVLTSLMFYVTAINFVIFYSVYQIFVVIIADFSRDIGVPEKEAKYILIAFSIADLVGRLCFGWITDRKFLQRQHYVMLCMALIGLNFLSFPFADSLGFLVAVCSLYGLFLGCTMIMFPILLVQFLKIDVLGVALGCMYFANGLSSFARPFLIGYFRDYLGSYSNIFFVLGGAFLIAALLWLLEKCFGPKTSSKRSYQLN